MRRIASVIMQKLIAPRVATANVGASCVKLALKG